MPEIVQCPSCERKLRVPDDMLGRKVKCPGCQTPFTCGNGDGGGAARDETPAPRRGVVTAPGAPRQAPARRDDDDEADAPTPRRSRDEDYDEDHPRRAAALQGGEKPGWRKVRLGVSLILYALYCWYGALGTGVLGGVAVAVIAALTIGSAVNAAGGNNPNSAAAAGVTGGVAILVSYLVVVGLVLLFLLARQVLLLTGQGIAMAAPRREGTMLKPMAIAAFSLGIGILIVQVVSWLVSVFSTGANLMAMGPPGGAGGPGGGPGGPQWANMVGMGGGLLSNVLSLLAWVMMLGYFVCSMLSFKSFASNTRQDGLGTQFIILMACFIVYGLGLPVVACLGGLFFVGGTVAMAGGAASNTQDAAAGGAVAMVLGFGCMGLVLLLGLGLVIWYNVLLVRLRSGIDRYLRNA